MYNRQARRAGLCHRAGRPRGRRRVTSPSRVALTAYGSGLAEVATWIGEEIELSPELSELLSIDLRTPARHARERRTFEHALQALSGGVRGR
jgi:hypothetical protein